jgi:hypothetical protein
MQTENLHLLAFRMIFLIMAQARIKNPGAASPRRIRSSPKPPTKVAITLRLDAARAEQLQAIAEAENRTLTNYVETALIRDLSMRDEATRVITMRAALDTSTRIDPNDVVRGDGESDAAYAKRQALLVDLWAIPDGG